MSFPGSITPSLRLDGTQQAYSDAAGTVSASAPLGRVARVNQPAPLSGYWLAKNTTDARPFRDAASFCFEPVPTTGNYGGHALDAPAGSTLPANACTIGLTFIDRTSPQVQPGMVRGLLAGVDNVTGRPFGPCIVNGQLCFYYGVGLLWQSAITIPLETRVDVAMRVTPTGLDVSANIGGVASSDSTAATIPAGTIASITAGLFPQTDEGAHASISQIVGVSSALNNTDRDLLLAWLVTQATATAFPANVNLVAWSGDSIGAGYGTRRYQCPAFAMLPALQALGPQIKILNMSVPSDTIAGQTAKFTASIAPRYSTSRNKNVHVIQVATNSLATSATAAQCLVDEYALCDASRALGNLVALCTVLPRSDAGLIAGFEAKRVAYNADVLTNGRLHADVIIDVAGVAGMGAFGDSNNAPNYQSDHAHPTAAGNALLLPVYQAAVLSLLAVTVIIPPSNGLSSVLTYDQSTWHRPGIDELGGGSQENVTLPRDPRTVPHADIFNQFVRQIVADATVAPSARIQVEFAASVPSVTAVVALNTSLVPADFTITDNGNGDTSLTISKYVGETLRPIELSIVEDVEIDRARVFPIAGGWRVKTKLGATGTDAAFVLALHAPTQH